ncbi:Transposable element Tc3 transposase, partial [Stegodyphus mimosarum]
MPRNVQFSKTEIAQIYCLKALGMKVVDIAGKMRRNRAGIYQILSKGDNFETKSRSGRPKQTTKRQDREILRSISTQKLSIRSVSREVTFPISKSTVHRRLQKRKHLIYRKMDRSPKLTARHKDARVQWARNHMHWTDEWLSVVFSDEKKFNLDGPDGWAYYWHDIRQEPQTFFSRQQGGGSVMVWAAFLFNGTTDIAFLEGRLCSEDYQKMLEMHLLPFGELLGGDQWIYQQDDCSVHVSNSTKEWFRRNQVTVMDWPALSPDLNPMENFWGILARDAYAKGRQFSTIHDLKLQIERSWFSPKPELLQTLVISMKDRVFNVITKNGSKI